MTILDRLFGPKSLADLDAIGLRKEEILLQRQRDRLLKKIEDVASAKQNVCAVIAVRAPREQAMTASGARQPEAG